MTSGVSGFDDRLNQILGQQAEKSGESVDAYIRHAVVSRLVQELTDRDDSQLGQLLRQLKSADIEAPLPVDPPLQPVRPLLDPERIAAVERTGLLDSPREDSYDRLVGMVADALQVPSAAMSLIDRNRQFYKSAIGLPAELEQARELPVDQSICQYTIDEGEPLVVEDARLHESLKNHPAVLGKLALSYMGVPLKDDDGHAVGTLCVWDEQPRQWTTGHLQILQDLAWIIRERIYE